ncbi:T9SS type A sorting domain-containing protein [Spirosoma sp. HMF3257]|uniref:T9SS type A sorting domain-containing protein n=1 Tax=Spirosoma telluris TaxID=2183553 RepID=A0A327NLW1_9BACT|nr:T9SS type A sorting domain-containing protein [Spirosoma telluris]RAI76157.1 hypothetical protein HMF3257_21780 [Spirosoma telluris]
MVQWNLSSEPTHITLYTSKGIRLLEKDVTGKRETLLSVKDLPEGMYVVEVVAGSVKLTQKFIRR